MKTGKTLVELATEVQRRAENKKDLVANTKNLDMVVNSEDKIALAVGGSHIFDVNSIAHAQIGAHTEIPKAYYDKMLTAAPRLLTTNVNEWFDRYPAPRMIRTLDGHARAFLSDKFAPDMENEDLAEAVLPVLMDMNLEVASCEITDRRLYIKAVDKSVSRELAKTGAFFGDGGHTIVRVAFPAITISNSEVGHGALSIQGGVYDAGCSNLSFFGERSMRRAHVGQKQTIAEGELYAMLSDKSKRLNSAAMWSTVRGVFERAQFDALVDKIEGTHADKITGDVVKVVELSSRRLGLLETEGKSVLDHLIRGGDISRFGLYNSRNGGQNFARIDGGLAVEMLDFGKPSAGSGYPTLFAIGTQGAVRGVFRSDDRGRSWIRVNDDRHEYGRRYRAIAGDPRVFGRVYVATDGRGVVYGEPA